MENKERIIIKKAICNRCKVVYDPLIAEIGEKCAMPSKNGYHRYCNGKLKLLKHIYKYEKTESEG